MYFLLMDPLEGFRGILDQKNYFRQKGVFRTNESGAAV